MFVATINIPGYLPMDDDPPVFETPAEAWEYLADERKRDDSAWTEDGSLDATTLELEAAADPNPMHAGHRTTGTIYGPTPGYDGGHDLGLAYSVTEDEDEDEDWFDSWGECSNCGRSVDLLGFDRDGSRRCDDSDPEHRYHHIDEKED